MAYGDVKPSFSLLSCVCVGAPLILFNSLHFFFFFILFFLRLCDASFSSLAGRKATKEYVKISDPEAMARQNKREKAKEWERRKEKKTHTLRNYVTRLTDYSHRWRRARQRDDADVRETAKSAVHVYSYASLLRSCVSWRFRWNLNYPKVFL